VRKQSFGRVRHGQRGLSIIEAMIALVIMGFGILSLAGVHGALSRGSEDARHRTEAVRLAQERIETLRSFTGITSTLVNGTISTTAANWNALASGVEVLNATSSNATYTRTWTLSGAATDALRNVQVAVQWVDRGGETRTVTLSSIVSNTDPSDTGFLGFPLPLNTNLKRPKDRNLDIPIKAIDLGNGESALKFGTSGQYVVFGNISGDVVKICTPTIENTPTDAQVVAALAASGTNGCESVTGYIITGYIAKDSSVPASDWTALQGSLGVDMSGITRVNAPARTVSCHIEDAVDQTTNVAIANYKSYLCVIPLTAPSPALTEHTPYYWQGKVRVAGPASWRGATSSFYVCQFDYSANRSLMNPANREYYPMNKSIDQQNFLIAATGNSNTSSTPACPGFMTATGVSTGALHQDCRAASNANYATDCPLSFAVANTYSLSYNLNGGSGTVPGITSYASGTDVATASGDSLTKLNSSFAGWNTSAAGTGAVYAAGATIRVTSNTTLYAQWSGGTTTTQLGTPAPAWTGSDPKTLSWTAISNASGYVVSSCVRANENSLTGCTPSSSASQSSPSITLPSLGNKNTYCYKVMASGTAPYTDSAASSTFCVYYRTQGQTGEYIYQ
jgi:Tfp pilus assembly protein PilV